jgi:hypothetical protein
MHKAIARYLLILAFASFAHGCKKDQGNGEARAFNSEVADPCFPGTTALTGCGLSFPYDYKAPEDMYTAFRQNSLWQKEMTSYKTGDPQVFATGKEHGLSEEETASILLYTASYYIQINSQLRKQSITDDYKPVIYLAASALRKLPRFAGKVFRGTRLTPEIKNKYLDAFKTKQPVQELAFTSTTKDLTTFFEFSGNTTYVIESSTGTEVEAFSQRPSEKEVLFAPGTWFQVVDIKDEPGQTKIYMKELLVQD